MYHSTPGLNVTKKKVSRVDARIAESAYAIAQWFYWAGTRIKACCLTPQVSGFWFRVFDLWFIVQGFEQRRDSWSMVSLGSDSRVPPRSDRLG